MTFFTNKPLETILPEKGLAATISAFPIQSMLDFEYPNSVVVDFADGNYNRNSIITVIQRKRLQNMLSPVELQPGNTIYVVQEACRNVLKITI